MGRRVGLVALLALALAPAARGDPPPPEAVLADLPFLDFPEPHRIVIDLAPAGSSRALRFMVDTGATHTVATPRAAAELGIRVRRHKADPYRRKTVLGSDVQIVVDTQSSDTASKTGWEYALLGGTFLRHYVLEVDFVGRRVRFLDPKRFEVPASLDAPGEAVLPLEMPMNRPAVEIALNGEQVLVMIDTGAPPPIVVSGKVADAAGLPASTQGSFTTHGTLGAMVSELRMLDELKLGPFSFTGLPTVVNPRGWYNIGLPSESVVGYELLEQFSTVRIDYPRQRLWLERNPDAVLTFGGQPFGTLDDAFAGEETSEPGD